MVPRWQRPAARGRGGPRSKPSGRVRRQVRPQPPDEPPRSEGACSPRRLSPSPVRSVIGRACAARAHRSAVCWSLRLVRGSRNSPHSAMLTRCRSERCRASRRRWSARCGSCRPPCSVASTWADRLALIPDGATQEGSVSRATAGPGGARDQHDGAYRGHEGRYGGVERDVRLPRASLDLAELPMAAKPLDVRCAAGAVRRRTGQ